MKTKRLINSSFVISLIIICVLQFCYQKQVVSQSLKFGASDLTDQYVDEIIIAFDPVASFGIDSYDASKMWNSEPSIPNFYSALGPSFLPYQVNMLPVLDDTTIYITLGLSVVISDNYHIKMLEEQGMPAGTEVFLIDSSISG